MRYRRPLISISLVLFLFTLGTAPAFGATHAQWIDSTAQLIPGSAAVGQIGDLLLWNDEVSFIISSIAHPYGYADSGGNIIDAVLCLRGVS